MYKNRSITAILLSASLLLSLAACGTSPAQTQVPTNPTEQTTAKQTDPTTEPAIPGPKKVQAADLLEDFTAKPVVEKKTDAAFTQAGFDWAVRLFKETYAQEKDNKTLLVSPLSVMIALAMTANGARENTLAEMEKVLGVGLKMADLNAYLHTYLNNLPSSERAKFSFANAIWFKDQADFAVEEAFLQTNVDYYEAAIRKAPFDASTVQEINQWVDQHTDHMITELLKQLNEEDRMILVNALAFDAKWAVPFQEENCQKDVFTDISGKETIATYMGGHVYSFLEDEEVTGFTRDYEGGTYRFVALLPKDEKGLEAYISGLTGEKLSALLQNEKEELVLIHLPKFSYDYDAGLNDILQALGMKDVFDPEKADLSGISQTPLYITQVLHKTHIDLDSEGTRAAAVTAVIVGNGGLMQEFKEVYLNRPFLYMIVDTATNLPIFVGTVTGF